MIKVSCPACQASYDVDESRLPAEGLRMRCPKCSESFQVHRDGSVAKSGGGAMPGTKKPLGRKPTQVGIGRPNAPAPAPPPVRGDEAPTASEEIDLPAPLSADDFADLPAPSTGGRSLDFDLFSDGGGEDLPAAKQREASSSDFDPFADMDLPAPFEGPGGTDLPAPMPGRGSSDIDLPAPMSRGQARAAQPITDEVT